MSNLFTERVLNMAAVTPQPEDYTGEDGLLYCGKCRPNATSRTEKSSFYRAVKKQKPLYRQPPHVV